MYKIRRKENIGSDHQSSINTIYATVIEEASKMTRLLVFWKAKHHKEPETNVMLVEYDNELVLNEDKLAQLYENINDVPYDYHKRT
jgi:hypothetical protein